MKIYELERNTAFRLVEDTEVYMFLHMDGMYANVRTKGNEIGLVGCNEEIEPVEKDLFILNT